MYGQKEIIVKGRSLEGQHGARVSLRLKDPLDVLSRTVLFSLYNWSDTPVDECELTFIRGAPESGCHLSRFEQYTREAKLSAFRSDKIDCQEGLPTLV